MKSHANGLDSFVWNVVAIWITPKEQIPHVTAKQVQIWIVLPAWFQVVQYPPAKDYDLTQSLKESEPSQVGTCLRKSYSQKLYLGHFEQVPTVC